MDPPFVKFKTDQWVNEQLQKMTVEEKIAQLMMITAYPKQSDASKAKIIEQIKKFKPLCILRWAGTSW